MSLIETWERLRDESEVEEIQRIITRIQNDNETISKGYAKRSIEYLDELEENWHLYDRDDLWHGTKEINGREIAREGLAPGDENDAFTGEYSDCPWISFSNFPYALNYSRRGTPSSEDVQTNVDFLYESEEYGTGLDGEPPDISTKKGRNKFLDEFEEDHYWSHLRSAILNFENIERAQKSDPLVVGIPYSKIEGETRKDRSEKVWMTGNKERAQMNEIELHQEGLGFLDIRTDIRIEDGMNFYVPHENLEEYREKYDSYDVNVLSIEAMEFKWDHENRDAYVKEGILDILPVWDIDSEYPFTLDRRESSYNECAWVPSISS